MTHPQPREVELAWKSHVRPRALPGRLLHACIPLEQSSLAQCSCSPVSMLGPLLQPQDQDGSSSSPRAVGAEGGFSSLREWGQNWPSRSCGAPERQILLMVTAPGSVLAAGLRGTPAQPLLWAQCVPPTAAPPGSGRDRTAVEMSQWLRGGSGGSPFHQRAGKHPTGCGSWWDPWCALTQCQEQPGSWNRDVIAGTVWAGNDASSKPAPRPSLLKAELSSPGRAQPCSQQHSPTAMCGSSSCSLSLVASAVLTTASAIITKLKH